MEVFHSILVQACLCALHVVADEAKLAIVFTYFFLFSLFFSAFFFSPTSGNLPCVKICFPQYFGITRRYMQKKKFFLGNFFPPKKKRKLSCDFSVAEPGPTPSFLSCFLFLLLRLLLFTHFGESPVRENYFF